MIEKLGYRDARILEVDLSADKKTLELVEACDLYHKIDLTKEEVIELANDFMGLADQMED